MNTARILKQAAYLIHLNGLHTGDQFAAPGPRGALDICAAVYIAAEKKTPPEFFTDEAASLRLIESSAKAMAAIRAISDALDNEPCETEIEPGTRVPDYIEHVSNWAATRAPFAPAPPTTSEVIGRILRAAQNLTTSQTAA
jgi:hypothetical protein